MKRRTLIQALGTLGIATAFAFGLTGAAQADDFKEVTVGVVGDYVAQWDTVNELLAPEKIRVKLVKYSDYATPNRALADGEIDLNAFQHKAFLART